MKNKDLQELLKQHPDDMEVVTAHYNGYEICVDWDFDCRKASLDYATYTSKYESNMEYYDYDKTFIEFVDEVEGKRVIVPVPTTKKDVLILDV
jgi:hypothetical protein